MTGSGSGTPAACSASRRLATTKPGAGPRHFDFHPSGRFAYVINELNSTFTAFTYEGATGTLKELHSAIEEAKADATGLFMMQYLFDHKLLPAAEKSLYTTFLASSFRTLRFGVHEAHGKGMALQFNYLMDKGAFVARPDGTFAVDFTKIQPAVRDLVRDLLTIEATGDYAGAKKMLDQLGVLRPALQQALAKLTDIPTDIEPISAAH